jgi:hypothetical protein
VPEIREFLRRDHGRGICVLQAWRYWLLNVDSKDLGSFDNLDDYLQFRITNVGLLYVTDPTGMKRRLLIFQLGLIHL